MAADFKKLEEASRLLVEVRLRPIQGGRFQPTNFPDQHAALYKAPKYKENGEVEKDANGNPIYEDVLLVESAQSMANRMERACWDDGADGDDRVGDYNEDCRNIPYVLAVDANDKKLTASPLEAHRLASPYIWNTQPAGLDKPLPDHLKEMFELKESRMVPWKKVAKALLEVDPGCLLHGVWFSDKDFSGGKVRLTRSLTGFVEARSPQPANYGFQKRDPVSDRTEPEAGQTAETGYGSVIGPMQDFTSPDIRAYFQLDAGRLRSYGLPPDKFKALLAWAIYKIRKVMIDGKETIGDLRTRCKFEVVGNPKAVLIKADDGKHEPWELPKLDDEMKGLLLALKGKNGPIEVRWIPKIEGKAELGDTPDKDFNLSDFAKLVRIDTERPKKGQKEKKHLIIFGEFTKGDEERLLKAHEGKDMALAILKKAIKSYREKYEQKVTGAKAAGEEEERQEEPE